MRGTVYLAAVSLVAVTGCSIPLTAQGPWQLPPRSPAFEHGYDSGARAGVDDWRRGEAYGYTDERDYRRASEGYRRQYGRLESYQHEYRQAYQRGYEDGYARSGDWRNDRRPPVVDGRYGPGAPPIRYQDPATQTGYSDGYESGLDDGRDRRTFDYVGERRYRSGDRGYERGFGTREAYKNRYRSAFRQGYEAGYADGRRNRD